MKVFLKKGGYLLADIWKILSLIIQTLILIPGMIFWGAVWLEADIDLPHFNYKEFLESNIFRAFLLISFMYSIGYFIFRKMEKSDEYSFKFGNSEKGVTFDGGGVIDKTVSLREFYLLVGRKIITGDEILELKSTDKLLVVGVSGKGKTTFLERCALKLHKEGKPFVYVTSNSSYLWHQLEWLKAKLPQSSLDFYNDFAKTSSPDALIVELENNDSNEKIISGVEQITKALENGAFLFLDETVYLLEIPEFKTLVFKALNDMNSGVAIAWQDFPERINDEHGLLSKVNYVVETAFSPERSSQR